MSKILNNREGAPKISELVSNEMPSSAFYQSFEDNLQRIGPTRQKRPFWRFEDSLPTDRPRIAPPLEKKRENFVVKPSLYEGYVGMTLPDHMVQDTDGKVIFRDSKRPVPVVRRPNVIPVTRAPDGEWALVWPKMADFLGAARSPVGRVRSATHRAPRWQVNNPIPVPDEPFSVDYPKLMERGPQLRQDIDGRPLSAKFVAGRQKVGGPDVRINPDNYDEIIESVTTYPPRRVKSKELPPGAVAAYHPYNSPGGPMVKVLDKLPKKRADQAKAHEMGHLLDQYSDYKIIERADGWEMLKNYDRLLWGEQAPWTKRGGYFGPTSRGYTSEQAREELVAEAIRAYMADPNYFKSTSPNTAKAIRRAINTHPNTKEIIQFNSGAPLRLNENRHKE